LREQQAAWKRSHWERWQVGTRRLRGQVGDALLYAQVWRGSLHHIEGHFGTGIQSYFNFLRFLVLLNLGGALLTVGFVVAPNAAFEGLRLNQTQQGPNSTGTASPDAWVPSPGGQGESSQNGSPDAWVPSPVCVGGESPQNGNLDA
ncbi:transmembrane channel-like protein 7, partial [Terrapene carolina triunguis]|uniref:transmembrane channel-like protein 7 n=1 Tax=Terrapene triunguis TaxID=2587831 RepID=UPI000E7763DF